VCDRDVTGDPSKLKVIRNVTELLLYVFIMNR
jgi:hypothetical protein